MSWITRWKKKDLRKWGGWHSFEDRENYLLAEIERLENEINILKTNDKLLDERLGRVRELALSAVIEYFQKNVIVQHYENGYNVAEKRGINEEWEDYKEPKEYWYIAADGSIVQNAKPDFINHLLDGLKSVGNYFETREEAEKALEKFKAWKRLKDKGFRFCGWATNEGIRGVDFEVPDSFFSEHNHSCISDETREDLDLLFGGEE